MHYISMFMYSDDFYPLCVCVIVSAEITWIQNIYIY